MLQAIEANGGSGKGHLLNDLWECSALNRFDPQFRYDTHALAQRYDTDIRVIQRWLKLVRELSKEA